MCQAQHAASASICLSVFLCVSALRESEDNEKMMSQESEEQVFWFRGTAVTGCPD